MSLRASKIAAIAALLSATLGGCGGAQRPSDSCRISAAFEQDPYLREAKLARCEAMAAREDARDYQQRQLQLEQQQQQQRQNALRRQQQRRQRHRAQQQQAGVRSNPDLPELGATAREAGVTCTQQGGRVVDRGEDVYACQLGGRTIFSVDLDGGRVQRIDGFYEGHDLGDWRSELEHRFGDPDHVQVDDSGFRVWMWVADDVGLALRMYDRGVHVTTASREGGARSSSGRCTGKVPTQPALRVVRTNRAAVRECYQQHLAEEPTADGKLKIRLLVDADGDVANLAVVGDIPAMGFRTCVGNVATQWRFPPPQGGPCALVEVPYDFTPTGGSPL